MNETPTRLTLFEDLLRRVAGGMRNSTLYAPRHPLVARNMAGLVSVLGALHQQQSSVAIGIVGHDLVVADTPMHRVSSTMGELIRKLKDNKVERIAFERGVTQDELVTLMQNLSRLGAKGLDTDKDLSTAHVRVGRLKSDDDKKQDGVRSDIAAIRQMYSKAVESAEVAWESASVEGIPDAPAGPETGQRAGESGTENPPGLMGLTRNAKFGNHTFTH